MYIHIILYHWEVSVVGHVKTTMGLPDNKCWIFPFLAGMSGFLASFVVPNVMVHADYMKKLVIAFIVCFISNIFIGPSTLIP